MMVVISCSGNVGWFGPKVGGHLAPFLYSSRELLQWLCYDDNTLKILSWLLLLLLLFYYYFILLLCCYNVIYKYYVIIMIMYLLAFFVVYRRYAEYSSS